MKTLKFDSIEIVHDRKRTVRNWRRRVAKAKLARAAVLWEYISNLFAIASLLMIFLGACIVDSSNDVKKGTLVMVLGLMVMVVTAVIRMASEEMEDQAGYTRRERR